MCFKCNIGMSYYVSPSVDTTIAICEACKYRCSVRREINNRLIFIHDPDACIMQQLELFKKKCK